VNREPVAALFVGEDGPYSNTPGIDAWGLSRDARGYMGRLPVVAHPPCERWGRYWGGGPSVRERRTLGDDGGCFASALASVRRCGGVLEHPEASHAWAAHGLAKPPRSGGWVRADDLEGWTCCVEQGHFGHRARKATWLYARGVFLPALPWGSSGTRARLDRGYHSTHERNAARATETPVERLTARERWETPEKFRDVLIETARSVYWQGIA
jgi:hypothetical protein